MPEKTLRKINSISPPGWRHRINVGHGIVTPGREDSSKELRRLQIDSTLSGKSVLDIGCSDGYFSFACEQRGATVTAIDDFTSSPNNDGVNGFSIAAELLGSNVEFIEMSVYDIDQLEKQFDAILLVNVLYHLRHPAMALDRIYAKLAAGGTLHLKTYFHQDVRFRSVGFDIRRKPFARFFEDAELNNDPSNWWGFNSRCIEALLRSAGFTQINKTARYRDRIYYLAIKG